MLNYKEYKKTRNLVKIAQVWRGMYELHKMMVNQSDFPELNNEESVKKAVVKLLKYNSDIKNYLENWLEEHNCNIKEEEIIFIKQNFLTE